MDVATCNQYMDWIGCSVCSLQCSVCSVLFIVLFVFFTVNGAGRKRGERNVHFANDFRVDVLAKDILSIDFLILQQGFVSVFGLHTRYKIQDVYLGPQ